MSFRPRPSHPPPAPDLIETAAAAWLSLRDRGMNAAQTEEFVRWLQQDPRHAAVFAELDRVWKDFDRLAAVPVDDSVEADCDLLAPRSRPQRHHTLTWTLISVAAAVTVLLLIASQIRVPRATVETAVGGFHKLDLPDGSVVQLNTDTAIETRFTATERRVQLIRGESFFTVAHDPARPFIVTSGRVSVRAVGTAFNVRQRDSAVEILVTNGRVEVDDAREGRSLLVAGDAPAGPPVLVAGERVTVAVEALRSDTANVASTVASVSAPEIRRALAWQERRLEFDAIPLAEVASEFNRYNRRKLVIGDPLLAAKRFSGTFRADSYESFVQLLEADFDVAVTRNEREIVLRLRR